jgi:hypothetical protein
MGFAIAELLNTSMTWAWSRPALSASASVSPSAAT